MFKPETPQDGSEVPEEVQRRPWQGCRGELSGNCTGAWVRAMWRAQRLVLSLYYHGVEMPEGCLDLEETPSDGPFLKL